MTQQPRYKLIPVKEGWLLVDMEAKINTGNYKAKKVMYDDETEGWVFTKQGEKHFNIKKQHKIIASTFIEDLPKLDAKEIEDLFESDIIEKLAEEKFPIPEEEIGNVYFGADIAHLRVGFKHGYKSNPAKFTEEQMRKAIEMAWQWDREFAPLNETTNEILKSFQPQYTERFCEIEMEWEKTFLYPDVKVPKVVNNTIKILRLI